MDTHGWIRLTQGYSKRADLSPQKDNLLILGESGDVLEALTRVPKLAEKYVGKIKLVYIDPPFNTSQTFTSYEDNLEHSIWLTMMRDRPIGEIVYEQIDERSQFERGRVYAGWFKSLYEKESFDSYSGEYELAKLLNTSPHIVWWHRLHENYNAYIYYTARDRYFPDFVAMDDTGTHWIIKR